MGQYRIFRLSAKNVNGLSAVEINPQGDIIQLTGKVGSGKSSVLDTIQQMIRGSLILKEGEDSGKAELALTDGEHRFAIQRQVKEGKPPTLNIYTGETLDQVKTKPGSFLKKLFGEGVIDDPTMFVKVKGGGVARKQLLLDATGIDTSKLDDEIAKITSARKSLNSVIANMRTTINVEEYDPDLPDEEVEQAKIVLEINQLNADKQAWDNGLKLVTQRKAESAKDLAVLENETYAEILAQEQKLQQMKKDYQQRDQQIKDFDAETVEMESQFNKMKEGFDQEYYETLLAQSKDVTTHNVKVRENNRLRGYIGQIEEKKEEYSILGRTKNDLEKQRQAALNLPVNGLSIGEDDVYWDKGDGKPVPGSKWSSGEAMFIGCAVRLAQVDQSELGVILVDDVSLLDEDYLDKLRAMMGDFQVWEVHNRIVGDSINCIKIEDGTICENDS